MLMKLTISEFREEGATGKTKEASARRQEGATKKHRKCQKRGSAKIKRESLLFSAKIDPGRVYMYAFVRMELRIKLFSNTKRRGLNFAAHSSTFAEMGELLSALERRTFTAALPH